MLNLKKNLFMFVCLRIVVGIWKAFPMFIHNMAQSLDPDMLINFTDKVLTTLKVWIVSFLHWHTASCQHSYTHCITKLPKLLNVQSSWFKRRVSSDFCTALYIKITHINAASLVFSLHYDMKRYFYKAGPICIATVRLSTCCENIRTVCGVTEGR